VSEIKSPKATREGGAFLRGADSNSRAWFAANAPLPEILTNLVLLMEAQEEGIMPLFHFGIDRRWHSSAPRRGPKFAEAYVKAVNGAPIGLA